MNKTIQLGEISIALTWKDIKNHLTVHPPDGRVTLAAPTNTRLEVARAYAISKLVWIRDQQRNRRTDSRQREQKRHLRRGGAREARPGNRANAGGTGKKNPNR